MHLLEIPKGALDIVSCYLEDYDTVLVSIACKVLNQYKPMSTSISMRSHGINWAARRGYLNILKILIQNGCSWDMYTCERAAEGGHLDALKWLRDEKNHPGVPLEQKCVRFCCKRWTP